MLIDRNVRKSAMARVRSLLESPPSGSGLSAYVVYNEEQLRQVQSKTLVPVNPRVFLIDSYIRPAEPTLPLVVLESSVVKRSFELGNIKGRRTVLMLHVVCRNRGERDDLASFLADNFGRTLTINNYTTTTPVLIEQGMVEDRIEIENVPVRDDIRDESSLDAWAMLTIGLQTQN